MWDFTVSYDTFVYLIGPAHQPPWVAERWRSIVGEFESLAGSLLSTAGIRSYQHEQDPYRQISFGALNWNERSHAKWTHVAGTRAAFVSAELWAPKWTTCEREGRVPRLYAAMGAKKLHGPLVSCSVFLLALDRSCRWRRQDAAAARLSGLLEASFAGHCIRPWGRQAGETGYRDGIQDLMSSGLLVSDLREVDTLDQRMLRGEWSPLRLDSTLS